jgi:hypothetical protein
MPKIERNDAHELREITRERKADERRRMADSATEDEQLQHRRRADKAAYLEEKLADRERSEREAR